VARVFRRLRDGRIKASLEQAEVVLLMELTEQVITLLGGEQDDEEASSAPAWAQGLGLSELDADQPAPSAPADPALARLLPDGRRDDPSAAAEFRRLTEGSVRSAKIRTHRAARGCLRRWSHGAPQTLDPAEAEAWARGLTDLRLVLAQRLGIRDEGDTEALSARIAMATEIGHEEWMGLVYDFLSYLQESLTVALTKSLPRDGRPAGEGE
jgi:hypothetical protein